MTRATRCARHSKASYGPGAFKEGEFVRGANESETSFAERGIIEAIQRFVGPEIAPGDVTEVCGGSSVYDVAHYVALDRAAGAVVLAFRGTAGVEDAFTDIAAKETGYALNVGSETLTGLAHSGVAASARAKLVALNSVVEAAVNAMFGGEDPRTPPRVFVTGHSLGGGVASLVALDIAARHPGWEVEGYTFGSAASLSENISQSGFARGIVRAFVMRDDVVPRMSLAALDWLKCLAKHVADLAGDTPSQQQQQQQSQQSQQQQQQQQQTFLTSAVEWAAKKTIGGTDVDMAAAVAQARKEFAERNPAGPKFLYPAGRLFWVHPRPPPPPKPLTTSAPNEGAPPLPPKPRKRTDDKGVEAEGECDVPPPLPPKNNLGRTQSELTKSSPEEKDEMFRYGVDIAEAPGVKWLEEIPLTDTFITDHYMVNYLLATKQFRF